MTFRRLAIVGFVCASAFAVWWSFTAGDRRRAAREADIRSTLARAESPVIFLGDSIVEFATLPSLVCGHPLVNAGVSGVSTTSGIDSVVAPLFGSAPPRLVLIALGANDAGKRRSADQFKSDYRSLIARLRPLGSGIALLGVPPTEGAMPQAQEESDRLIRAYNETLPSLARETGADFIPLPPMPAGHTVDGLHLNSAGYAIWNAAVLNGIARLICAADHSDMQR